MKAPGPAGFLRVEDREDGLRVVTLEHGKVNALDLELCVVLETALLDAAETAPALVLTGQGKCFSAGVDLERLLAGGAAYVERFVPALMALLERLFFLPMPVVAAINGHAIAGGCILACAADRRVCVREGAGLGVPELRVGLPFPTIGIEILRQCVPARELGELVLSGRTQAPPEALSLGLVDELADPGALLEVACERARDLAGLPRAAFTLTKEQLRHPARELVAMHRGSIDGAVLDQWSDGASLARVRSYVERTLRR